MPPKYAVGLPPSHALGQALDELRRSSLTDQSTRRMTELLVRFTINSLALHKHRQRQGLASAA